MVKKIFKDEQLKKNREPNVTIDIPIATVRKTFAVKEPLVKDLANYAAFLSEHHGKAIDEDRVVDGLLSVLRRDRLFAAWLHRERGGN